MENARETIFALATAPGKSGVAVIRISGAQALPALTRLTGKRDWKPNTATFTSFRRPSSIDIIDKGLALYFKAPRSFTGEDVVELHLHGGFAIIREMLAALAEMEGLRPAERGEFTKRAFLNGKMDLIEAEGLADLIEAETTEQKRQAMRQMEGAMSRYYGTLRTSILSALAHLEAYIDFPDEEIPESVLTGLQGEIDVIKTLIGTALSDDNKGERVRDGLSVVILGAPNAGKSSLLNALAKRDAAIVSSTAGTTRDVIEIHMDIAGFPVVLMDTAGLREAGDAVEEEGIRRAIQRAESADVKLILFDASAAKPDGKSRGLIDYNSLIIYNKIDVPGATKPGADGFAISTKTGQGLDALMEALTQKITASFSADSAPLITRSRHRALLLDALSHLEAIDFAAPLELTCEELRLAAGAVGKITGKIAVDDVLGVIFQQFCIGK